MSVNVFYVNVNESRAKGHPKEGGQNYEFVGFFAVEFATENARLPVRRRPPLVIIGIRPKSAALFFLLEWIVFGRGVLTPSWGLAVLIISRRTRMITEVSDADVVLPSLGVGRKDVVCFLNRYELGVKGRVRRIVVRVV